MLKPLSESLQKLCRAQRALIRRKRRSKVRVSFTHSTSSRGSKAGQTKRSPRRLKSVDSQHILLAAPGPLKKQGGLRNNVRPEKADGPYPVFGRQDVSSSQNNLCWQPSPSENGPVVPGVGIRNRPHWGIIPKVPVPSLLRPEAERLSPKATPEHALNTNPTEKPPAGNTSHRRPLYTVFPKPSPPRKPPGRIAQHPTTNTIHSESVRRSIKQQHHLSSLVPSNTPSNITDVKPANGEVPVASTKSALETPASGATSQLLDQSLIQQESLEGFTREPEDYAIATGAVRKHRVSTPSILETHVSIHTVHELLPYRRQFRDAGLAVTSADQKAPPANKNTRRYQDSGSKDGRLWLDGGSSSARGVLSTGTKDSTSDEVVDIFTASPVAFTRANALPRSEVETEKTMRERQPLSQYQQKPEPTGAAPSKLRHSPGDIKTAQRRPSAITFKEKPLPAKPGSAPLGVIEVTGDGSCITAKSEYTLELGKKADKSLPAIAASRTSPQTRHGTSSLGKTNWMYDSRPPPTTISEEKKPSPKKHMIQVRNIRQCILHQRDRVLLEIQSTGSKIIPPADKVKEAGTVSEIELPETWKKAVGTPSSFEKALDDVVRKLDDMRESKYPADPEMDRIKSRRAPPRPPSPSRRLQRAAELRRQRMAEAAVAPANVVQEDKDISDKDVLKGLNIICAASADAELDARIQARTGLRLRRFLADLKTFESLSQDWMVEGDSQRSTRRLAKETRGASEKDARVRISSKPREPSSSLS